MKKKIIFICLLFFTLTSYIFCNDLKKIDNTIVKKEKNIVDNFEDNNMVLFYCFNKSKIQPISKLDNVKVTLENNKE